jgi:predicted methyltransferase
VLIIFKLKKGTQMKTTLLAAIFMTMVSCAHNPHRGGVEKKLNKSANGKHRSEKNITRNTYRNPVETLMFFEVKPNMSVVEISPGAGWYSEILGPFLKKKGTLHLTIFSDDSKKSYAPKLNKSIRDLTSNKDQFGKVSFSTLETPDFVSSIGAENSMDRVLTFRNIHNWMKDGKLEEVLKEFYKVLKPGGILGIVEHRDRSGKKQDPMAKSGYVREDYLIKKVQDIGFEFLAKSEVNANYNDNANHPNGVWTLPPRLRYEGKNKEKYLAIGESDRMTIKFKKPLQILK